MAGYKPIAIILRNLDAGKQPPRWADPYTNLRPYSVCGIMDRRKSDTARSKRSTLHNKSLAGKQMESSDLSRRTFIKNTAAATAVAMAAPTVLKAKSAASAS